MQKARMAEDAWNSRDPERVSLVYTSRQHVVELTSFSFPH